MIAHSSAPCVVAHTHRDPRPILLGGEKPPRRDQPADAEILAYSNRGFRFLLSTTVNAPSSSSAAADAPPPENFLCQQDQDALGFAGSPAVVQKKEEEAGPGPRMSFAIQYVSSKSKTVSFDFDVPRGASLYFYHMLEHILGHFPSMLTCLHDCLSHRSLGSPGGSRYPRYSAERNHYFCICRT